MQFRYFSLAAVAACLLLLSLSAVSSAPVPLVPSRSAFGRCDPSATRVDCGYYGATHASLIPHQNLTPHSQESTKRNASSAAAAGLRPALQTHPTRRGASRRVSRRPAARPRRHAVATAPAPTTRASAMQATRPAPHPASTTAASGQTATSKTAAAAATIAPATRAFRARRVRRERACSRAAPATTCAPATASLRNAATPLRLPPSR